MSSQILLISFCIPTLILLKVNIMNKDQVKGSIKQTAGKVQQKFGEAVGSEKQQAKGIGKQVEGAVQKGIGNAKENR
jgi:uncharacterized protein YjbJ (UPF0337 family)